MNAVRPACNFFLPQWLFGRAKAPHALSVVCLWAGLSDWQPWHCFSSFPCCCLTRVSWAKYTQSYRKAQAWILMSSWRSHRGGGEILVLIAYGYNKTRYWRARGIITCLVLLETECRGMRNIVGKPSIYNMLRKPQPLLPKRLGVYSWNIYASKWCGCCR